MKVDQVAAVCGGRSSKVQQPETVGGKNREGEKRTWGTLICGTGIC